MTEDEWFTSTSPEPMLEFVRGTAQASDRKLWLFTCASLRRKWPTLRGEFQSAVEVIELFVDGKAPKEALLVAMAAVVGEPMGDGDEGVDPWPPAAEATGADWASSDVEQRGQSHLIRCIFGHPYRVRPAIDPAWLTPKVVTLTRTIYEDRAFDRAPQLADALNDAGCGDQDILQHCRSGGPHVRGCWAIDLLLGKG